MAVVTERDEQLLIGGQWVGARSGGRFDVTNPATGEIVGSMPDSDAEDVDDAIDAADAAFPAWRSLPAIERGRVLRRAADLLRERTDEISVVMTAEQGKPLA
jgi:succinate-semialdehyde dehydrogenase/glutarate-semialdehyde dehydrogenase